MRNKTVLLAVLIFSGLVLAPAAPASANFDPVKCAGQALAEALGEAQRGDDPCAPDFNECWEDYHGVYVSDATGRGWSDAQDACEEDALGEANIKIVPQGAATGTAAGVTNGKGSSLHVATGIMEPATYTGVFCYDSHSEFDRPGSFPGTDGSLKDGCA